MNNLAKLLEQIRGELTFVELAKRTGVSRQTLMALEAGASTKISTLRTIAKACAVSEDQWEELLVAWTACELGDEDFARLNQRLSPKNLRKGQGDELMVTMFKRLGKADRQAIITAMMVPSIRAVIPQLWHLYEQGLKAAKSGLRNEFPAGYLHLTAKDFLIAQNPSANLGQKRGGPAW